MTLYSTFTLKKSENTDHSVSLQVFLTTTQEDVLSVTTEDLLFTVSTDSSRLSRTTLRASQAL